MAASSMASEAEYRRLLKGLDRQNRQPVRRSARAKAVYPARSRTRSLEPLGSIDEIVHSDFSDSAVSPPPPPLRHRRPSSPMNFSRPDPTNFSSRLSREQDRGKRAGSNVEATKLPIRGPRSSETSYNVQAIPPFRVGEKLPDEPTFGEDSDDGELPTKSRARPTTHASEQRYVRRPASAGSTRRSSDRGRIGASLTAAPAAWDNSVTSSRASSRLESGRNLRDGVASASYSGIAINRTAPLPAQDNTYKSASTQTVHDRERAEQDRQNLRPAKRNAAERSGERLPTVSIRDDVSIIESRTPGRRNSVSNSSSSNSFANMPNGKNSSAGVRSNKGKKLPRRPAPPSTHSSEDTTNSEERPPCWAGSDFDPRSILTDKEIEKLKKKGINPALYAEMQAAKLKGRESGGSKGRKWIGPLVGNGYTG